MDWIYENNKNNTSRYVLGTVGKNPLICIGVNPSTAEPGKLDRTLESVNRISKTNGFDSWIMLNIYPQRSTDPNGLHSFRDYYLNKENRECIKNIFKENKPTIWAAWGTLITKRSYLINCLYEIVELSKDYGCQWVRVGPLSKDGHPHHPLFLKSTEKQKKFNIDEYLKIASLEAVFSYINTFTNNIDYNFSDFYQLLEKADFVDCNYNSHFSTAPIDMDLELKRLPRADYKLTKALITGILREDHFSDDSFERRVENGDVTRVLRKLRKLIY